MGAVRKFGGCCFWCRCCCSVLLVVVQWMIRLLVRNPRAQWPGICLTLQASSSAPHCSSHLWGRPDPTSETASPELAVSRTRGGTGAGLNSEQHLGRRYCVDISHARNLVFMPDCPNSMTPPRTELVLQNKRAKCPVSVYAARVAIFFIMSLQCCPPRYTVQSF
jgi:hypothetical protein